MFPNRSASLCRNKIESQSFFMPTFLRLKSCPQSYPPFGSMCCNQTMGVSEMITAIFPVDAMRRSGAVCAIRTLIES
jgi:hypothetical protein